MMRVLSFFIIALLYASAPAFAQETQPDANAQKDIKVPTADFSSLKHTKSGRVDKIIDGLTILLKDDTIIRLASLDIPDFSDWRDAPYSYAAMDLLVETLPEGTEVMIYQTRMAKKGRLNRLKHELAHIMVKKDDLWLQGLLLSHGLARVYTTPNATELVDQMLNAENMAREASLGIWGNESDHKVITPEQTADHLGHFAIVEGTVQKAASVRNNIYLNFGKDWKSDFTIMLTPALRKQLSRQGINPLGLAQQKIRARGWLREYNGSLIELEDASHLETFPVDQLSNQKLQNTPESPSLSANP